MMKKKFISRGLQSNKHGMQWQNWLSRM